MRIQPANTVPHAARFRSPVRLGVPFAVAMCVLGAGACARTQPLQPESRLGAGGADKAYSWNGNATRKSYGSKDLGPPQAGAGAGSTAAGDTVLFESDSTELTPEAKTILDGYVAQLRRSSARALSIEGHADERGTREYNIGLGARRAANVKIYLLSQGMLESQIKTISYGKERPIATCDDISCWARNRRAQLVVAGY